MSMHGSLLYRTMRPESKECDGSDIHPIAVETYSFSAIVTNRTANGYGFAGLIDEKTIKAGLHAIGPLIRNMVHIGPHTMQLSGNFPWHEEEMLKRKKQEEEKNQIKQQNDWRRN